MSSINQINSQSSVLFSSTVCFCHCGQHADQLWALSAAVHAKQEKKNKKNIDPKYNTGMECDIGSVLHKEGSPPCNVNTPVNVCCHVPFYLEHIEDLPHNSSSKTNCELFLWLYVLTSIWRTANLHIPGPQLFLLMVLRVNYVQLVNSRHIFVTYQSVFQTYYT